jgi:hypothetical protein
MLFWIRLSFLLSASQAIGVPRAFLDSNLEQARNASTLAQAPALSMAIPRGLKAPLPFDEEIFDPTHVVSDPPRDCRWCTQSLITRPVPNDSLNYTTVKGNYACPFEIRRRSQPPRRDYIGYLNRLHAEYPNPNSGSPEKQRYAPDRPL